MVNRFVAGDRAASSPEGAKVLACTHPAFDGPVGLNVIENAQLLNEEALWQQGPDRSTDLKAHFTHFLYEQFTSTINPHLNRFQ
jgi:hypothetical protein